MGSQSAVVVSQLGLLGVQVWAMERGWAWVPASLLTAPLGGCTVLLGANQPWLQYRRKGGNEYWPSVCLSFCLLLKLPILWLPNQGQTLGS